MLPVLASVAIGFAFLVSSALDEMGEDDLARLAAARDLPALGLIHDGDLCLKDGEAAPADTWLGLVLLQDIAADVVIDPDTQLGPRIDPESAATLEVVSIPVGKPAWPLSPGDVVSLIVVPATTPTAAQLAAPPRLDSAIVLATPWGDDANAGDEGVMLVAIPEQPGRAAKLGLIAAGARITLVAGIATGDQPTAPTATQTAAAGTATPAEGATPANDPVTPATIESPTATVAVTAASASTPAATSTLPPCDQSVTTPPTADATAPERTPERTATN